MGDNDDGSLGLLTSTNINLSPLLSVKWQPCLIVVFIVYPFIY